MQREHAKDARMDRMNRAIRSLVVTAVCTWAAFVVAAESKPTARVVATVNGEAITTADLDRAHWINNVPEAARERLRDGLIEQLIEQRLIAQFLKERKIVVPKRDVEEQLSLIRQAVSQVSEAADAANISDTELREEITLPMAWRIYANKEITQERLQAYFRENRHRFDGAMLEVRHILIKVSGPPDAPQWKAAEKRMAGIRREIESGEIDFAGAARLYSEAPSAQRDGVVHKVRYNGHMPTKFNEVAFSLETGELSKPFRTQFGVHICEVIERTPGMNSLEDVREEVQRAAADDLWRVTVGKLRKNAKIERPE
jgi:parvulin-like peptidyl-prolyl isomerase